MGNVKSKYLDRTNILLNISDIFELSSFLLVSVVYLHFCGNFFPSRKNFTQRHGSQHVPQRGGGQQPRLAAVVVHVGHGVNGVLHLVVHDGVDEDRH